MKTAVLIPCYNEDATIAKVVADYRRLLPDARIYMYDNNSTDSSAELARGAGATVVPEYQQGRGFAVRSMLLDIDDDVYLMVDGDDTGLEDQEAPRRSAVDVVAPLESNARGRQGAHR